MKTIILAAGLSKRMEGANKLLLPWKDRTIIEETIINALLYTDKVYIVTGNERDGIMDKAKKYPVIEIYNPDYKQGQETSIRCACNKLEGDLCFIPGDMPLITKEYFKRAEEALKGFQSARPIFDGKPGHPVMIASSLVNVIKAENNKRVRDIIREYNHNFYEDDIAVVTDIDTPEEYKKSSSFLQLQTEGKSS